VRVCVFTTDFILLTPCAFFASDDEISEIMSRMHRTTTAVVNRQTSQKYSHPPALYPIQIAILSGQICLFMFLCYFFFSPKQMYFFIYAPKVAPDLFFITPLEHEREREREKIRPCMCDLHDS
jgi:hypothetical protein